jgi:hypothetical protein
VSLDTCKRAWRSGRAMLHGNGLGQRVVLEHVLDASVAKQTPRFSSVSRFARGCTAKTLENNSFDLLTLRYSQIRNLNRSVILLDA